MTVIRAIMTLIDAAFELAELVFIICLFFGTFICLAIVIGYLITKLYIVLKVELERDKKKRAQNK